MSIKDEARTYIDKKHPWWHDVGVGIVQGSHYRGGFIKGAVWASQREPSDAEVEAAAKALAGRFGEPPYLPWSEWGELSQDEFRDDARAALMAALSARNTRETQ